MNPKAIYKYCKQLGCCEACCLRYMGIKSPNAYEDVDNYVIKYQDEVDKPKSTIDQSQDKAETTETKEKLLDISKSEDPIQTNGDSTDNNTSNGDSMTDNAPPNKKRRLDVCASCLGVLQEDNWKDGYVMVKEVLFTKKYECTTFACALSAPITTLLRERAITLRLSHEFPGYAEIVTALKEAWKWSFGVKLAAKIDKTLDSGAISPLLITLNYDYADDLQELEILKKMSPQFFEDRSKQRRRFVTEFTRRSVEQALQTASLSALLAVGGGLPAVGVRAMCIGVVCTHAPMYLAGRYVKLSRTLPQSPWILGGKRVLPSSVQEIIYKPLADLYNMSGAEAERRLKLIAAGREDVDVRCLGEGRPFAIEVTDPTRQLTAEELAKACEQISQSGEVIVKQFVPITKEDLAQLKKGEETKSKTYEAICIKLSHSKFEDVSPDSPVKVTSEDIARINSYRNTPPNTQLKITQSNTNTNLEISNSAVDIENKDKNIMVSNVSLKIAETPDIIKETTNIPKTCDTNIKDSGGNNIDNRTDNIGNVKQPSQEITDTSDTCLKVEQAENLDSTKKVTDTDSKMDTSLDDQEAAEATQEIAKTFKNGQKESGDSLECSSDLVDTSIEENQDNAQDVKIVIQQKTPIRVLHRRPLLTRTRQILELKAMAVPDHPQLFRIFVSTSAGTYVKEWAHGELGRSGPSLGDVLGSKVDMLALDVTAVHLDWPPQ